jgi:outer membrane protein assembly factor BamA
MKMPFTFFLLFLLFSIEAIGQVSDSTKVVQKKEKIKKGWNFGALPAIAYDSDLGLKYGALANFYYYGDGTVYPDYKHSIYVEWNRTTKGSGTNQFIYDSKYLIPNVRVTAEASYLTEQTLDFYGFNGYNAYYNSNFEDQNNPNDYISRVFYRYDRKLLRLKLDFQGKLYENKLRWLAGFTHFNTKINTVDIDKLNKGKSGKDILPDSTDLLYDKFVKWGMISQDQKNGGISNVVTLGLVYDTRDNEPNPMKGMWTEALLLTSPSFLGNKFGYTRIAITHRQYFTIFPEVLNFAGRLSYQAKVAGTMPFYMLPYFYTPRINRDGLGGGKTIRGVKRDRVVGEDFILGNMELRWKFLRTVFMNQNIYAALTPFADFGRITGKFKTESTDPEALTYLKQGKDESWHVGYGAGLYVAMNQNFVVAFTYGLAADKNDGNSGFYINLDFLF